MSVPTVLTPGPLVGSDRFPDMDRRFNHEVDGGTLTMLLDQGLYRHLRFQQPGTSIGWFDIITSPGQLTIRGDMGDYMFAREPDMLRDFFTSSLNPGYWREKLLAQDVTSPARDYERDLFVKYVLEHFWEARTDYEPDVARELWEEIRRGPLDDYTDTHSAENARWELEHFRSDAAPRYRYSLDYEEDFHDYTAQYLWCCHAILWVARAYREYHKAVAA